MNKNHGNCEKNLEIFIETLEDVYLVNCLLFYHKKLEGNAWHGGFEWFKLIMQRPDKHCDFRKYVVISERKLNTP